MAGPVYLSGDRIDLRTVEDDDLEFFHEATNHPEVRRYIAGFDGPVSRAEYEREEFEKHRTEGVSLVVCDGETRVGNVSLGPVNDEHGWANLGAWLHPEYHGEGYAIEACALLLDYAFGEHGLRRVRAQHLGPNGDSRRLLDRLGFTQEGVARDHNRFEGGVVDDVRYGLLADEWPGSERIVE
jgi:RimJ/RimL family protein N-acetyltransferase